MLKLKKLNKIILFTGLTPLILVIIGFLLWGFIEEKDLQTVISGIILFCSGFLLINAFFLYVYFSKARQQNNPQALGKTLWFVGLLISNIVVDILSYNYVNYSTQTTTFIIENKAGKIVKKMFFDDGDNKYFIAPVDPGSTKTRALSFMSEASVDYSFELKGKAYQGQLLAKGSQYQGEKVKMVIHRNGRVNIGHL